MINPRVQPARVFIPLTFDATKMPMLVLFLKKKEKKTTKRLDALLLHLLLLLLLPPSRHRVVVPSRWRSVVVPSCWRRVVSSWQRRVLWWSVVVHVVSSVKRMNVSSVKRKKKEREN
jgi:hypothetical protein